LQREKEKLAAVIKKTRKRELTFADLQKQCSDEAIALFHHYHEEVEKYNRAQSEGRQDGAAATPSREESPHAMRLSLTNILTELENIEVSLCWWVYLALEYYDILTFQFYLLYYNACSPTTEPQSLRPGLRLVPYHNQLRKGLQVLGDRGEKITILIPLRVGMLDSLLKPYRF
jgi:hypothetical protein